jgi:hypothetical protein
VKVNTNGAAIRKGQYQPAGEAVISTPVASVTFSGLGSEQVAIDYDWRHSGTGIERLDLEINGAAAPAGSRVVRDQQEATLGIREDRAEPGFSIADLVSVVANASARGAAYLLAEQDYVQPIFMVTEGYSLDSAILAGDRERFNSRVGIWNNAAQQSVTSITVMIASGRARITETSRILCLI